MNCKAAKQAQIIVKGVQGVKPRLVAQPVWQLSISMEWLIHHNRFYFDLDLCNERSFFTWMV